MCSHQTWSRSCKHNVVNLGTAGIFQRGRGRKIKRDRQTETERNKQREREKEKQKEKERVDSKNHGQRRDAQLVQYVQTNHKQFY